MLEVSDGLIVRKHAMPKAVKFDFFFRVNVKLNACLTLIGGGLRKDHGFPNCLCKLALQKTIGLPKRSGRNDALSMLDRPRR